MKNIAALKKSALFQKSAFTLLEMMVSISIIIILTILFVANYHSANQRTDIIMTAQELVADIHLAENNALGLVKYNGTVPAGGWGLSFNLGTSNSSYTLFADLNAPGALGYMQYDAGTEGVVAYGARVTKLPPGIIITGLQTATASSTAANVTFLPPDPQTNIYDAVTGATSTSLIITLKELTTNTTKTVRVNFLGLAEVTN